MNRRSIMTLISLLLLGWVGWRAVEGSVAGYSYSEGRKRARLGDYERALPALDRARVGELQAPAAWLAAEVRLGIWQRRVADGESLDAVQPLLIAAAEDQAKALAASPASGWYWVGLGDIYHQLERVERFEAGLPLSLVGQDGWAFVGRCGRLAVGMMRIGLQREPNWYLFHDQLAYVYYDYRLMEETMGAVYNSALALPVYELHAYRTLRPRDREIENTFARGARDALGQTPWLRPVIHQIALGRLEVRREQWETAKNDLLLALAGPTEALNVAEANFYLAKVWAEQGEAENAEQALLIAASHPAIAPLAAGLRAEWIERSGSAREALEAWLAVRQYDPKRIDVALKIATLSRELGDLRRAQHILREMQRWHPSVGSLRVEWVRTAIASGDMSAAKEGIEALRVLDPSHPALPGLNAALKAGESLPER
jgi:tetratricopeptide (TPR) repeat protein